MGASRMGFNLLQKRGRENFIYVWERRHGAYKLDWQLVFEDTVMPLVCKVVGHSKYFPDPNVPACKRCHNYL